MMQTPITSRAKGILAGSLILASCWAAGCVTRGTLVPHPPPAPQEEEMTESPSAEHVWVPGHWLWRAGGYVWISGRWAVPPRPGAVWVPDRLRQSGGAWYFTPGHWR